MMTADDCRKKAAEAEALCRLVSLHTDKARLTAMAADWGRRALELDRRAAPTATSDGAPTKGPHEPS